ncbi:MAG: hypothetical protein AAGE84_27625 [Cyanobacteria bacterium P01_G01_bin.39]
MKNNCRKLRISEPDFDFYVLSSNDIKFLPHELAVHSKSLGIAAMSCAALLGFSSTALADTTSDAAGHATGHGFAHATGHGLAHATGHGLAHGLGHTVGLAIPILNIALIGFSAYRLGKFLFDDSETKEEIKSYTLNEISKYYRTIMYGKDSHLGLDGQLQYVKDEFCKSKQKLFDRSIQPTLESVISRLD